MPFFNKLFFTKKDCNSYGDKIASPDIGSIDRNCATFGADQIRVLLFRECERRGERKLLFDSVAVEKFSTKCPCPVTTRDVEQKGDIYTEIDDGFVYQYKRVEREDVNLFKEMVFGTVAMTYRGPSFKIHAIDEPRCIMCTKVFPAPEHYPSKEGEKHSFGTRENSMSTDANSSNGSMLGVASPSNQINSYGSRLSSELGKNSTSSSTCSSWDLDVSLAPPQHGSSQSWEGSNTSGAGSLSSLRQRWLRAVSTSLSRFESDDFSSVYPFSIDTTHESYDNRSRRHKTRIGLAVLIELTRGHERRMEAQLLQHVALLEGMLDRLRCWCIRTAKNKGQGLVVRMHRASTRCALWLVRLFVNASISSTPLLWHKVLLASETPRKLRAQTLRRSLHLMCRLLDDLDTKSTNFFLSTLVTAVLTYHLGWVHTVFSSQNQKLVETLSKQYPCNPLWAQLCDLYGALGTPLKVAHTVIVGETEKIGLINAVLTFLTYFIRSGNVERRYERRCSPERELATAIELLEELETKRHLRNKNVALDKHDETMLGHELRSMHRKSWKRQVDIPIANSSQDLGNTYQFGNVEATVSKLKRSESKLKNLNSSAINSVKSDIEMNLKYKLFSDEENERLTNLDKNANSNPVKVVISDTSLREYAKREENLQKSTPPSRFQNKIEPQDFEETFLGIKLESMEPYVDNVCDLVKMGMDNTDGIEHLSDKDPDVRFVLGGEEKSIESKFRSQPSCNCQCSFAFPRVPSTSAQLPEGVLRKIIQRNFPESSKSIQSSASTATRHTTTGFCPNCLGRTYAPSYEYEDNKLLLETPTNATEVLRSCGASSSVSNRGIKMNRCNSLEYLMEANEVVELPMPRSKKIASSAENKLEQEAGLSGLLRFGEVRNVNTGCKTETCDNGYMWGLVAQGLSKRKKKKRKKKNSIDEFESEESEDEWWDCVREEINAAVHFPAIDEPVAEALCIVADVDSWQVGVISSNAPALKGPLPVGMSRLVANMLEAFVHIWRKYNSPVHSIGILEGKLKEMWLQSEALAEMLIGAEVGDVSITSLSDALDLDAADIPLLLAVAATHSPLVAQRFGLTFA